MALEELPHGDGGVEVMGCLPYLRNGGVLEATKMSAQATNRARTFLLIMAF